MKDLDSLRYVMGVEDDGKTVFSKKWSGGPWLKYDDVVNILVGLGSTLDPVCPVDAASCKFAKFQVLCRRGGRYCQHDKKKRGKHEG